MNFFSQLAVKPWLTSGDPVVDSHDGKEFALPIPTFGLRVFLAVATMLFSLMVVAYSERMLFGDWKITPEPWLLWANTLILVLSSVAFHRAFTSARKGEMEGVKANFFAAGILSAAFLAGQLLASQQLVGMGFFISSNVSVAFFYMLTVTHALHLVGGLIAWGLTASKVWRDGSSVAEVRLSVELCAFYWHFLLLVWMVLFSLLLLT
ncbi:MAG: cytochrome c oxidase subunit 3 [Rhodospirillales bacterium]|nr:cytochrome c oxidase subunit 3 [Rhodospirillales bacterium]